MIPYVTIGYREQWAVLFLDHECVVFAGMSGWRIADWLLNAGTVRIRGKNAWPHWSTGPMLMLPRLYEERHFSCRVQAKRLTRPVWIVLVTGHSVLQIAPTGEPLKSLYVGPDNKGFQKVFNKLEWFNHPTIPRGTIFPLLFYSFLLHKTFFIFLLGQHLGSLVTPPGLPGQPWA